MAQRIFLANDLVQFSWALVIVGLLLIVGLVLDERLRNRIE